MCGYMFKVLVSTNRVNSAPRILYPRVCDPPLEDVHVILGPFASGAAGVPQPARNRRGLGERPLQVGLGYLESPFRFRSSVRWDECSKRRTASIYRGMT